MRTVLLIEKRNVTVSIFAYIFGRSGDDLSLQEAGESGSRRDRMRRGRPMTKIRESANSLRTQSKARQHLFQ
jgi:hypothetical protein